MCYIHSDAEREASPGPLSNGRARDPEEDYVMTIELFYLTAQLHRWLNVRVARHLEAQAAKLSH